MEKILRQRFGMEVVSPSVRVSQGGQYLELDVLAYANSSLNQVYVVAVKSHPREVSILQMKTLPGRFRYFFPNTRRKRYWAFWRQSISPQHCANASMMAFLKWIPRTIFKPRPGNQLWAGEPTASGSFKPVSHQRDPTMQLLGNLQSAVLLDLARTDLDHLQPERVEDQDSVHVSISSSRMKSI